MKVKVYPLSFSLYTSQIYAGLFDLAHAGEIDLEFTWRPVKTISEMKSKPGKPTNNRIAYLELWEDDGRHYTICYDMFDSCRIISPSGLEKCDVYFKRSHSSNYFNGENEDWQTSHPEWRRKIYPYGLSFPCVSEHEFGLLKRTLIFMAATGVYYRQPRSAVKAIKRVLRGTSVPLKWRLPDALTERPVDQSDSDYVVFETRLFSEAQERNSPLASKLNDDRIQLVRQLRKEFGDRFIGGLIPDEHTRKRCPDPDLLTEKRNSRDEYLALMRNCKAAISSKGLGGGTAWKLPEFLAMSRCIVSERLSYELPRPLQDGVNYLLFDDVDGCVSACNRLLEDRHLAREMQRENYEYYHKHVKASSIVLNSLNAAKAACDRQSIRQPLAAQPQPAIPHTPAATDARAWATHYG